MKESEKELIKRAKEGDQFALETILTDKKSLINVATRPYFFKGGDESDLAEEAMIAMIGAVMSYDDQKNDSFDAYAATLMKRRLINAVKGANRKKHSALNDSESLSVPLDSGGEFERAATEEDPIDRYLAEENSVRFYENARQILTDEEFMILKLYLNGYAYREIAERLKTTSKDVDNAIYRVKKKIKREKGLFFDDEG